MLSEWFLQALLEGHGLWGCWCFCCSCCQVCDSVIVAAVFFFYNCCCWYGISVATKPITVCPSFSLGACLGIPSSAPSCRLLQRRVYQKLMLINFCLSSMIRCLYLPFGNNIFCSVVNCWLLFVWERLPAYSLVTVRALMLLVP